jgi:hypothetical protein
MSFPPDGAGADSSVKAAQWGLSPSGILGNVSAGTSAAADGGETGAVFILAIVTTGGFESPDVNLWV